MSSGAMVRVDGMRISIPAVTVTAAVTSAKFGAVTRMVADPTRTPETGMLTVVLPARIVTVGDPTVATPVLLELTLNVRPPTGAAPDRVSVRFLVSRVATPRV